MKTLLICPSDRPTSGSLAKSFPLATIPLLGQSLLEYWLSHLASAGQKEIMILADAQPEATRSHVGDGARWGLKVEVMAESRELTSAQAMLKYAKEVGAGTSSSSIVVLDHFPGLPEHTLFDSFANFYAGVTAWISTAATPDRVGFHQISSGVWVGMRSQISPLAKIEGPCWIGNRVSIGPKAHIGPGVVIEDGCCIQGAAEISRSYIAPHTFVGKFTEISNSVAIGNLLVDWQSDSMVLVPDSFVLCALREPKLRQAGLLTRVSEIYSRNKEDVQMLWKHLLMNREG